MGSLPDADPSVMTLGGGSELQEMAEQFKSAADQIEELHVADVDKSIDQEIGEKVRKLEQLKQQLEE